MLRRHHQHRRLQLQLLLLLGHMRWWWQALALYWCPQARCHNLTSLPKA